LGFVWDLVIGAWNFRDFHQAGRFQKSANPLFELWRSNNSMAEIKSTLDLVMERTRNLTLSAEEKQAQKQIEIGNRIKGFVQKLQDGLLTQNQLKIDYERLKKDSNLSDDSLLVNEILTRLDPDQNTQILLETLEECCRLDTATIRASIEDYRDAFNRAAQKRAAQLKEDLAQKHSISGSAVIPNLDADERWHQEAQDMRRQFVDRLSQTMDKLTAG
jgi:hypothetical protein